MCFVDLIKGLIPLNLFSFTNNFHNKQKSLKILYNFRDFVFKESMEKIWFPRCSQMKEDEEYFNLDKKEKKKYKNTKKFLTLIE